MSRRGDLRLIGITTVRNEGDIIGQSLTHAARLYDLILVVDCGSWDDTVARIEEVAAVHPHVVLLGTVQGGHAESVRRHLFAHFAPHLPSTAWWGTVDADEFPADDLRETVAVAHAEGADHVCFEMAQFYITKREAAEGRAGPGDRNRPVQERRLAYVMDEVGRRLFRNLPWLRWNHDTSWPERLVRWGSRRVFIRHYQYRDLEQLRLRIETRSQSALSDDFLRMHEHWRRPRIEDYFLDDADPRLRWAEPRAALVPDDRLPAHWMPLWPASLYGHARAILYGRTPQRPADLLTEVDVHGVLAKMRTDDVD